MTTDLRQKIEAMAKDADIGWGKAYGLFAKVVQEKGLKIGAEIGVAFGGHAESLLKIPITKLYGVDPYLHLENYNDPMNLPQPEFDQLYQYTLERLSPFAERYQHIRKSSIDAVNDIAGEIDFVYVDADHTFQGVVRDLTAWFPKVKVGGIIGGHDYGHPNFPGVKRAVDEFFSPFGWAVHTEGEGVWWVEKMTEGVVNREGCGLSTDAGSAPQQDVLEESQKAIIHKFMQKEDVVVDATSLVGEWGKYVLQRVSDVKLHLVDGTNITLDEYCRTKGLHRINFLRVNASGREFNVLSGAQDLLQRENIDYVQFRFTDTSPDSDTKLVRLLDTMRSYHYELFLVQNNLALRIEKISPGLYQFRNRDFLAVNGRLKILLLGLPPVMLDLDQLCREYGIKPRGVIHVGAHEGKELADYLKMGFQRIFFIEANPEVYQRLQNHIQGRANVSAANVAVSDFNGTITLHVTNFDQSSSILPLKEHKEVYPAIQEVFQREVPCRTLDDLLKEKGMPSQDYNMLNIDIQGAELKALRGAVNTLGSIEAINTEVNYKELYEGCALIHEIDEFLELQGFQRVRTTCPIHSSWGDAFYVKRKG